MEKIILIACLILSASATLMSLYYLRRAREHCQNIIDIVSQKNS
jgi:hypothetical protein